MPGLLLAAMDRSSEAVSQLRKALEIDPAAADTHRNLAMVLFQMGKTAEASQQWREVVRLQPDNPLALGQLARLLAAGSDASLRNGAEAVNLAQRAAGLTKDGDPDILDVLAAACAETGRFPEALQTARKAMDLATE